MNCYPDTFSRLVWTLGADAEGLLGSSSSSFDQKWARFLSRSDTCMERIAENGNNSIAYYMGTRSVVDDIVGIAERHGEWREAEARLLLSNCSLNIDEQQQKQQDIIERTQWRHGQEQVLFWGTSYGTILGSTLAALYPQRSRRIILDSVLSPQFFFNATLDGSIIDSDAILAKFAVFCHKYGPEKCAFYRDTEQAILRDIDAVTFDLISAPLAVAASSYRGPDLITWSDIKRLIAQSLYRPIDFFPLLARLLHDVSNGNGSSFADYKAASNAVAVPDVQKGLYNLSTRCKSDGPYSPACQRPGEWLEEGLLAISCGDGPKGHTTSKGDFKEYWNSTKSQSSVFGDLWAEWDLECVGWTALTKWKYDGNSSH
jgi:hypothetical protein